MPQKGFFFDQGKCIGCGACEIACKLWNGVEVGPRWRRVVTVEEGLYPQIRAINVSLPCLHCGNPLCLEACPMKAVSKRPQDGLVVVDRGQCIGCRFCAWACPFGAPQLGNDGKIEKCTFCEDRPEGIPRACEEVCPTGAIIAGSLDDLDALVREKAAGRLISQANPSLFLK